VPDQGRRGVLGLIGLIGSAPVLCACTTSAGTGAATAVAPAQRALPDLSGIGVRMDAPAVYDRVSWGINDSGRARVQQMGVGRWLDSQLGSHPGGAAASQGQALPAEVKAVIDGYGISRRPVAQLARDFDQTRRDADAKPSEEERAASRTAYQQALNVAGREAAQRFVLRALYSPAQLQEQMTWFWMNHFNVFLFKNNVRATIGDYEDRAIRPNALGRFRDLLRATMLHPAMLVYLDNAQNAVNRINENYARELMELHTLGVDAGYTQRDVQELARVLTGLGVNFGRDRPKVRADLEARYVADGLFEFNPMRHDFGDKQFLGRTIRGRGLAEIDEVIDVLVAHPATSRFVARKLAQYFVDDAPGEPLLERLVRAFRTDPGGDIAAMLRALFASPPSRSWACRPSSPPTTSQA
jgi:uncharacterized protein (DUF1800 family)